MTRIPTANYGAAPSTQFQWATTDNDLFDRELDLYNLAQAVENHDHSSGRGLPVTGIAPGSVVSGSLGALAVLTANIDNLAVTNAKLGAGAVTYDKITWPLVQSANTMAGGFRIRETSNTYAFGFYMAANGLAVLGSGTVSSIPTNLILGQSGQTSFGVSQGAAFVNVMQAANTIGNGLRFYNTNTSLTSDIYNDAGGVGVLATQGATSMWFSAGKASFGASFDATARVNLVQGGGANTDGMYITYLSGLGRWYIDASGNAHLQSASTQVQLMHSVSALAPLANGVHALGQPTLRWTNVYTQALDVSGALVLAGALSGVTTLAMGGALTGVTTAVFGGAVSGITNLTIGGALAGATTGAFSGAVSLGSATVGPGAVTANGGVAAASLMPLSNNTGAIGIVGNIWNAITVTDGFKPGGGSWTATSDDRSKFSTKTRKYERGLETVLLLTPQRFEYNGLYGTPKGMAFVGLSAQQAQEIDPDLVKSFPAPRTPGDPEEDVLHLDASNLSYMLINAVKELTKRLEALEDRKN